MATDDPGDRGDAGEPAVPATAADEERGAGTMETAASGNRRDDALVQGFDKDRDAAAAAARTEAVDQETRADREAATSADRAAAAGADRDAATTAPADRDAAPPGDSRRRFLQLATCAIGGGVGAAVLIPAMRFVGHPVGEPIVSAATAPIDAIAVGALGEIPVRVPMVVHQVRDAWATERNVALGAAWIRRGPDGQIAVLSSVCPHKGCAIGFAAEARQFECPCHGAVFDLAGRRVKGPAARDLDPLPFTVEGERVKVTWVRYQPGGADRKPA